MFPERLRALRHGQNITLEQLAADLNKQYPGSDERANTSSQIGNWERGVRTPSYIEIRKLAEYFDVTMDYLSGKSDHDEYDLGKLFLSGKQLSFNHKLLTSEDRYGLFQLIEGYLHGKKRRTIHDENDQQEELDLGLDDNKK
ncbi:Transcriptional regulator, xre family [Pediococcus damnosus]|uniref:Transcriptional regulator, xre family n=1 Tax=Pediococcus damnosus TaxID=51663 RepID=A0AAC9FJH2_9LACO|nr:helix-turn-helix transcriptional regulator [Pediococcus damnosus]AMV60903.1 Transcriptional regulator, xre family [Pediococcus damnosus]AMV63470.1 Transcriptional regulator, xre family [Pediococcus damnosus]AMV65263.1 Transcriptional regulator, xre family [Pediococcus damnosus]AMV66595.1 Transcriptional regulator, xre family [Pediococcus damnosus]KJU75065.1 Cro/Cl family transcriptional regulator [Pediococcus damnosus LMG 28219]